MTQTLLDDRDEELITAARDVLLRNFAFGRHHVGAALRGASGRIYTGIHVGSRRINVCAEEVALGHALAEGEREFEAIVALIMMGSDDEPELVSPCGVCREVVGFYAPDISVICLGEDGAARKYRAADLLPAPFLLPAEAAARAAGASDQPRSA